MTWIERALAAIGSVVEAVVAYFRWVASWRRRRLAMPKRDWDYSREHKRLRRLDAQEDAIARATMLRGYDTRDPEQRRKERNKRKRVSARAGR